MAIKITFDAADAIAASFNFADAVRKASKDIGDFTVKVIQFNEHGQAVRGTVEQMSAAGQKIASTFDVAGNAVILSGKKVAESTQTIKAALDAITAQTGRAAAAGQAEKLFPIPPTASISQILRYQNALNTFNKSIATTGIGAQQLGQIFNLAAQGPAALAAQLQTFPGTAQQVARNLLAVGAAAQQAGQQGAAAGQAIVISWQSALRILEVQLFRRLVTTAVNAIRDGISSALEYQVRLQQVANVAGQTTSAAFERLRVTVRGLSEEFAVPPTDVLRAAQTAITTQGGNAAEGLNILREAMVLSNASGIELDASMKLLTTTLEAFGLKADQAGRVTNTLFLAAQQSRIPIDEMKNAIGRISQTAGGLGVTLEQVTALFLTIASQGGRPTEAFSLLNQVMGRLLTPTKELEDVFRGLGVPTAQMGIQIHGLVGFLNLLNREAQRSPERLGELAGSIRTLRALMAITGDQTQIFQQQLANLVDPAAAARVQEASDRVQQTEAQFIRQQFQTIKNIFTEDVGQAFNKAVVDIVKGLGGASAAAETFLGALKAIVVAFLGMRFVPALFTSITASITTASTGMGVVAGAVTRFLNPIIALGSLIAGVKLLIDSFADARQAARLQAIKDEIEKIGKEAEQAAARITALSATRQAAFREEVAEAFRPALQFAARRVQLAEDVKSEILKFEGEIAQGFRVQSQAFLDNLRKNLSETRSAIQRAQSDIISSERAIEQFRQQIKERGFRTRLGLEEDPLAGIQIIEQRRQEVMRDVEAAYFSRDREQIEAARRGLQELMSLSEEQLRLETEHGRRTAEQFNAIPWEIRYGQRVRVFHVDRTAFERRQIELLELQQRLEENRIATIRANEAEQERRQTAAQANVRIFEAQLRNIETFRAFTSTGRFLPRFQAKDIVPGGGKAAALAEFDRLADSIRESAKRQGVDLGVINQVIKDRRQALVDSIDATVTLTAAQDNLNRISRETVVITQRIVDLEGQLAQRERERVEAIRILRTQAVGLDQLIATAQESEIRRGSALSIASADIAAELSLAAQQIQFAFRTFNAEGGQTQANLGLISAAVTRFNTAVTAVREHTPRDVSSPFFEALQREVNAFSRTNLPGLQTAITNAGAAFRWVTGATTELHEARVEAHALAEAAAGPGGAIAGGFRTIGPAAEAASVTVVRTVGEMRAAANLTAAAITNITTQLEALRTAPRPLPFTAPGPIGLGAIPGHAKGGYIGPRGTDTLLAWLTPGEYVMDAKNTRKFYTQLLQMSSGQTPRYYAGGGPVSVGDINVHVTGHAQSEKTIREIGRGIRRELKRGTISFD